MQKIFSVGIFMLIVGGVMILNGVVLGNIHRNQKIYETITARAEYINALQPMLDDLDTGIWGIISVYDPTEARKVDVNEREQYKILKKIRDNIGFALELADDPEVELRLQMIERSVKSLSRKIDKLRAKIALQKLDLKSTAIFSKDSVKGSSLTDSYVDEMQAMVERMRFVMNSIRQRINEYMKEEMLVVVQTHKKIAQDNKRWAIINVAGISILFLLAIYHLCFLTLKR